MKKLWLKFCDWWLGQDPYQDWKTLYEKQGFVLDNLIRKQRVTESENRELRDSLDALRDMKTAQAKHPQCQCGKVAKVEPRKANRVSSKGRNTNKKRLEHKIK